MLSTALAFADLDGKVCNNTSVVLLIEWKGKRLLFVGDAEWDGAYKEGEKGNCAWNVMWNLRKKQLERPARFLQDRPSRQRQRDALGTDARRQQGRAAGHSRCDPSGGSKAKAKAVVSTRRGNYETIPRTDLLAEIGKRVSNTKNYAAAFKKAGMKTSTVPKFGEFEKKSFAKPQPLAHRSRTHAAGTRRDSSTSRSKPERTGPMMKADGVVYVIVGRWRSDLRQPWTNE